MLEPVTTYYTGDSGRTVNLADYTQRVQEDQNMLDTESLMKYGNWVFDNLDNLIDLTDIDSVKVEKPNMVLPKGFIPINEIASNFAITIKQQNGAASLRRGFYRLLPHPKKINILGFNTWRTDVLFNEGPSSDIIYKYGCNVGPLVNSCAVGRQSKPRGFLSSYDSDKETFLRNLENKTIYVSSAEMVHVNDGILTFNAKEVLWFTW